MKKDLSKEEIEELIKDRIELRKTQQELVDRDSTIELLFSVAEAVQNAETVDLALEGCLQKICNTLQWPVGHVYLLADEEPAKLTPTKIWYIKDESAFARFRDVTENTSFKQGEGLPGRVLANGEPAWIVDVSKDPNFPRANLAADIGVKGGFAIPVASDDGLIAVLEFFTPVSMEPDKKLLQIMSLIGRQLGGMILRKKTTDALYKQERLLQAVFDTIPMGVFVKDTKGRYLMANKVLASAHGMTPEEFVRHKPSELPIVSAAELVEVEAGDAHVLKSGEILHIPEEKFTLAGGEETWVRRIKSPLVDETGEITGLVGIREDITERKKAEEELQSREKQFREMLESSPIGVTIVNSADENIFVNATTSEHSGYSIEELKALKASQLFFSPKERQKILDLARNKENIKDYEVELLRKDGSTWWSLLTIEQLHFEGQRASIVWSYDISELKAADARLQDAVESLPVAFTLYDSEDRIVLWNRLTNEYFPQLTPYVSKGISYREILQMAVEEVGDDLSPDEKLAWIESRYRLLKEGGSYEQTLDNGRTFISSSVPTSDGGIVTIRMEITDRKQTELKLLDSERQFRQLLESSPIGVSVINKEDRLLFFSSSVIKRTGYTAEELQNLLAASLVKSKEERQKLLEMAVRQEPIRDYEVEMVRKDGSTWWSLMTVDQIDFEGQRGSLTWDFDISERKAAEQELEEAQALLHESIESLTEGFVVYDAEDELVISNSAFRKSFSIADEYFRPGTSYEKFLREAARVVRKTLGGRTPEEAERRIQMRLKEHRNPSGQPAALAREDGGFVQIEERITPSGYHVGLRTDVTELVRAREKAEETAKTKASFLATMSHEIRTPMNGVIGMIDLLRQSKLDDDQLQMIETIKSSAFSLLTIINDILDFSKIEAGKLNLEKIPISIVDAVESVGESLAITARNKNIQLCVYVDPDIPDGVVGDQVRLRQIIFNLGGNAIKFTEQGKVLIRADRLPSDDDTQAIIRLQVIDDGIGISEAAQKSLFQAFSQVDDSTTRRFGGTGLGLSICQRLIELMGGEIGVESVEGKGSSFYVTLTLPIAEDHSFKREAEDLTDLKVLLAFEDPELLALIPNYLEYAGARTEAVEQMSGIKEAALSAAQAGDPFDVIVLGSSWGLEDQIALIKELTSDIKITPKYVVACRQRSRKEREQLGNTVYLDADPMQRGAFIHSVEIAVGRASPDVEHDDDIPIEPEKAPTIEEAAAMGQLILLAEDNLTNQDVIKRQLNALGYAVEIANDGVEALECLEIGSYAMLLTDCHMPNMDGFELTKTIRQSEANSTVRLPIVAITASVMKEEVDSCYASGMDDFLPKPLEMNKLRSMLRRRMPVSKNSVAPATQSSFANDETVTKIKEVASGGKLAIDPAALKSVFGDDEETFVEILKDFVEPASSNAEEINAAYAERSAERVAQAAHKLKSSSRSVGANDLADLCQTLEDAGNAANWELIDQAAPLLSSTIGEVIDYINVL